MDINVNITLGASPALLAALAALAGAAAQTAPAAQPEPVKPARKQAVKNDLKPAPVQVEDKKEEPKQDAQESAVISYETFSKTIIPINQVVGPDKMRELIAEFGGKGTLRTIPEERRQEFIDRAKELAEGGAA